VTNKLYKYKITNVPTELGADRDQKLGADKMKPSKNKVFRTYDLTQLISE
jgi:hypothetical protein